MAEEGSDFLAFPEDDDFHKVTAAPQVPERRIREKQEGEALDAAKSAPWRVARAGDQFKSVPTYSPLLRLHEEISDFAAFISPTELEEEIGDHAVSSIINIIEKVFPSARVEVFGSRANGLVLPTSDWDLVLFGVQPTVPNMRRLASQIEAAGVSSNMEVISSARVPIIKVAEKLSGITIDIAFEASSGLVTRALINDYVRRYPAVRPLALVLKYFLIQRGLNETYSGGVGSFLLVMMIVHVVQQADLKLNPQNSSASQGAHSGSKRGRAAVESVTICNEMNLGTLLVSFFELYGYNLNYATTGISVRGKHGCYFKKSSRGWADASRPTMLSLENPVDPLLDVGKNSWNIQMVRKAFAHAHTCLARACREWLSRNDAASTSQARRNRIVVAPQSILATIIHIDPLLELRGVELSASFASALEAGSALVVEELETDVSAAKRRRMGEESELEEEKKAEPDNVDVEGAVVQALGTINSAGVPLRHARLFADIFTRKERKVDEAAKNAVGWY